MSVLFAAEGHSNSYLEDLDSSQHFQIGNAKSLCTTFLASPINIPARRTRKIEELVPNKEGPALHE